ncbi:uncharacterized protein TRAVEDRAFT_42052 [Trametes versicolor FP-101664 SS1]|uniref:uncharacterized protein n=1 Tax=Trametes versicolor (strain FP-101664) TaxID=717944 RepID=UPI00046243AA|nr:uncharacterized protein TRAVEDRAFT_42052 [Trametes versicolor FP-101664 SS1]EIW64645.1 hypothetical protein TRAVEDRAFT_42052 [Trametes versicolor FP-101664 SS1]
MAPINPSAASFAKNLKGTQMEAALRARSESRPTPGIIPGFLERSLLFVLFTLCSAAYAVFDTCAGTRDSSPSVENHSYDEETMPRAGILHPSAQHQPRRKEVRAERTFLGGSAAQPL